MNHRSIPTQLGRALRAILAMSIATTALLPTFAQAEEHWKTYEGTSGPGKGKHIVLVSGDEEYRSEEALPMLGRLLAETHGFTCTVLFAIDPATGIIDPNYGQNLPGLEALKKADLMIIFTRFRDLPSDQMKYIDKFLKRGGAVIGMRTSTHAFNVDRKKEWAHYGNGYRGSEDAWEDGFGRLVLGEKWISHHGSHKHESTIGILPDAVKSHPVLRGIKSGEIFAPSDVYGVRLPLPGDSTPLVLGQVTARKGEYDENDLFYGMRDTDDEAVAGEKNSPMMPVAWTKTYQIPGGKTGRVFTTTMGASSDLMNAPLRRLMVNATYWAVGLEDEIPATGTKADIVGDYTPTQFRFVDDTHWDKLGLKVSDIN
jgi:hypothetical protein